MTAKEIFTVIFMSMGFVCFLLSAIGVFRFKDFYARLHAAGVCEAAGLVLCSVGFLIYEGLSATGIKIFAVFTAVFVASPIGTHIITRVAYKQSVKDAAETPAEAAARAVRREVLGIGAEDAGAGHGLKPKEEFGEKVREDGGEA